MALPLVRAALYLCVSGLVGSPLLWAANGLAPGRLGRAWLLSCAVGVAGLTVAGLWLQVEAMNGGAASWSLLAEVARDLPVGRAAAARLVASSAAAILLVQQEEPPLNILAVLGAVGAASLAWGGHGAAGEGAAGALALAADIAHLLAAAFWVGAVAALALLSIGVGGGAAFASAMKRFAAPGTAAVAVIAASGLFNAWRLLGPQPLSAVASTGYGRLLGLKLMLFVAMLAIAAANRWRRGPALAQAATPAQAAAARRAAQRSLALEFACGLGVLLVVGWLGQLPPPGDG